MSLLLSVLFWLHVVGAIGWLGAAMVFGMLIGPTLPTLSTASRGELVAKLFPKYIRYAVAFTIITPIFGVVLALDMANGNFALFAPTTNFGLFISTGALLSVIVMVISLAVVAPTGRKIVRLTEEAIKGSGPPPPELPAAFKRLRIASTSGMMLLFLVVVCMVAAATL
jgi:uncharacterized membrane protein